jgi:hypothetical protein
MFQVYVLILLSGRLDGRDSMRTSKGWIGGGCSWLGLLHPLLGVDSMREETKHGEHGV